MQSSLQSQLSNLKKNQKTSPTLPYKAQCSLLFDFRFANIIDTETVYEIGYEGLIELAKIDDNFEKYLKTLFSSTSKYFNREMIPKNEIKNFDEKIKNLLYDLSPYFSYKYSHQVIEYLIKVYKVNLYLCDDYIFSFLCHYENPIFIKMLQNVNFNEHKTWSFLENFAKDGVIIPKEIMYKFCKNNFEFISRLISFYIDKINFLNEQYFLFINNVIKYKIENMNNVSPKEEDKNLFSLIVKYISFVDKNIQKMNENKEDKIVREYYSMLKILLTKVNLSYEYIKAIANDLCVQVINNLNIENSFSFIISILAMISRKYFDMNSKEELFKDESLQIFFEKNHFLSEAASFLINGNIENSAYLAYMLIFSSFQIQKFGSVKDFLVLLFSNENVVKHTLLLISKRKKEIPKWQLIEDLNQKNINLAYISLYRDNKISTLPVSNNKLDLYFSIISSSVPQVMKAINEINKSKNKIDDENVLSAIASKFTMFDEEIILNAILNCKNIPKEKIIEDIMKFYIEIMKGKINSYTKKLLKQIEDILDKHKGNDTKYILYKKVLFNNKEMSYTKFEFDKVEFFYEIIEVITYNKETKNEKLNCSNILKAFSLYFGTKGNDKDIDLIEKLISLDVFYSNYNDIYNEILKQFIKYISTFENVDTFDHLKKIAIILFKRNDIDIITELLEVHFKSGKQIFLSILLADKEEIFNDKLFNYLMGIIKEEKKIEYILFMTLLMHLSDIPEEHFSYIFGNTNLKFNFASFESIFTKKDNSKSFDEKRNNAMISLSNIISKNKIELRINKKFLLRIFESDLNLEDLYTISLETLLKYQNDKTENITFKLISLFPRRNAFSSNKNKKQISDITIKSLSNIKSNICEILLMNYLFYYPNSEKEIILKLNNVTISQTVIDVLFEKPFPNESISSNEEFFTIISFCVKNKVNAFQLGISLTASQIEKYLKYFKDNVKKISQNEIVFLFKLIIFSQKAANVKILKDAIDIVNKGEEIDINICFAIYSISKSLSEISEEESTQIIKKIEEMFIKLVNEINIENLFNYECEKKINLLCSTANNISYKHPQQDNDFLVNTYTKISDNNSLSAITKKEVFEILLTSTIDFIREHSSLKEKIEPAYYYKYIDLIINYESKNSKYNSQKLLTLSQIELLEQNVKCTSYLYCKLYEKFKSNRAEVLSLYAFSKKKTLFHWLKIVEEILSSKYPKKPYSLSTQILTYAHTKKDMICRIDDQTVPPTLVSCMSIVFDTNEEIYDKLVLISRKYSLVDNCIMELYTKTKNKYAKNYILKTLAPIVNETCVNSGLYNFILDNIIIKGEENKCENLIHFYTILINVTKNESQYKLVKKAFDVIFNKINDVKLEMNNVILSCLICKFVIMAFDLNPIGSISYINKFMPKFIKLILRLNDFAGKNKKICDLLIDNLSSLSKSAFCEHISPFTSDLMSAILDYANNKTEEKNIKEIFAKIAQKNMFDINFEVVKKNKNKLNSLLLHYFNSSIQCADKLVIADVYMKIIAFFIEILNSHQILSSSICDCMSSFFLKINEKQLKKIFEKILNFLREKNDLKEYQLENSIISFQIFNTILSVIKDIFIGNYYPKYKNIQLDLLNLANAQMFKSDNKHYSLNQKRPRVNEPDSQFTYYKLNSLLLENTKLNFNYSKGENLPDSIDEVCEIIIEEYKLRGDEDEITQYYEESIKDCMLAIFSNIKDDDTYKSLNDDLLNILREENHISRILSLKTILYLLENIKQRYLTLVGDIVPYVADMLEDSNERVHALAVEVISYIEKYTGESYHTYLE